MPAYLYRKMSSAWHWDPYHRHSARRWDALRLTAIPDRGYGNGYDSGRVPSFVGNSLPAWSPARLSRFRPYVRRSSCVRFSLPLCRKVPLFDGDQAGCLLSSNYDKRLAFFRSEHAAGRGPNVPPVG
jgi:hypothetical protein